MALEFRLLGEVAVVHDDTAIDLGHARQRGVLAVLSVEAGRVVPVGTLLDRVWADNHPRHARNALAGYVSRLRQVLAVGDDVQLRRADGGYRLAVDPQSVDLHRFRDLVTQARAATTTTVALDRFELALGLWRGDAFATVDTPWLKDMRATLHTERLAAVLDRNDLALRLGRHTDLLSDLATWAAAYPLDERLAGQLINALYRSGRQADALRRYELVRAKLADELGMDPSPALSELHHRVLNADPCLTVAHGTARDVILQLPAPVSAPGRNDLPRDIADFAGRRTELARLLTAGETEKTVVVHALDGMAGVGKTTLAVHTAHRLAGRYPDGQLFLDLHGHSPSQPPVTPMAALYTLLRAVGVPGDDIPDDPGARAARWRAELASRKILVVLDNAADTAQVRPLLPGTARSLTLITSRRRLVDLDTAHVTSLNVLGVQDAITLFTTAVGDDRVTGETDAVREIVTRCGHLPLAIHIAAARLRSRPAWTARHLADRLRRARSPLAELSAGDRSVATALTLSYAHLDSARQRMFRLLGVHPGPDIDAEAAASLAAMDIADAGRQLDSLVDDHLVQEPTAGRYQLHDLVRQHARAVAQTDEPDDALRRVIDFYLHTAYRGSRLLDQQHPPIDIGTPVTGCVPTPLADDAAAMAWFDANHHNLRAARAAAEKAGWDAAVWQLAWTVDNFHYRRGYIHDNITSWLAGLAAAERLGDLSAQARAHRRLGLVYTPLGAQQQKAALHHLKRSLTLSEKIGDRLGQAGAHFVLGFAWTCWGDYEQALPCITEARDSYRDLGNTKWETRTLSMLGACHTRLGHHSQARGYCESALALCQQHNDLYGQANSLDNLGVIAAATGQHAEALHHYQQALTLWHTLDNTYHQAGTLTALGDSHRELGHHEQARQAWRQAADLELTTRVRPSDAPRL